MSLYKLRDYQSEALSDLQGSFRQGLTRPVLYASVGAGKTVIAAHIVARALDKGKSVLFIAPYTALINQTAKSFMDQGIPQPGIIQAQHEWTDSSKRLQIGSIQTLSRRGFPDVDLIINDECHLVYKGLTNYMEDFNTPVIGLSGTPFTKGLGKIYDNLIEVKPMRELINDKYLSDYVAYSQGKPDLSKVKIVAGEYHEGQLGDAMSDPKIVGDIISTWLRKGENRPTICFAVNVAHAEYVGTEFEKVNVSCQVITGKTPMEDREVYFDEFKRGNIKILINVGVLVAGFDSVVHVMIDAAPTKSEIRHVQKCGRNLRTAKGKEVGIFLDHAGNLTTLGFPDDISVDELCQGKKNESGKVEKKEAVKKEKLPKECTSCQVMKKADEHTCSKCGFTPKFIENVEIEEGDLIELRPSKHTKTDKQRIFSELMGLKAEDNLKGRGKADGYYAYLYKDICGVWPRNMTNKAITPSEQIRGFVKHKKIAFSRNKNKGFKL